MSKFGLSLSFEEGECSICHKIKQVRIVYGNGLIARICEDCLKKLGNMSTEEVLEKYGKKTDEHFDFMTKEEAKKSFEIIRK